MRNMKFVFLILWSVSLHSCVSQESLDNSSSGYVYVCTGRYAKVYHVADDCEGLENCCGDVEQVSVKEAEEMGRRGCRRCAR